MAKLMDYTNSNGKTQWLALREAETACGDRCSECGVFIATGESSEPRKCIDCGGEDPYANDKEVEHAYFVRCTTCRRLNDIQEIDIISELPSKPLRQYTARCTQCNATFEFRIEEDHFFTSFPVNEAAFKDFKLKLEALEDKLFEIDINA